MSGAVFRLNISLMSENSHSDTDSTGHTFGLKENRQFKKKMLFSNFVNSSFSSTTKRLISNEIIVHKIKRWV